MEDERAASPRDAERARLQPPSKTSGKNVASATSTGKLVSGSNKSTLPSNGRDAGKGRVHDDDDDWALAIDEWWESNAKNNEKKGGSGELTSHPHSSLNMPSLPSALVLPSAADLTEPNVAVIVQVWLHPTPFCSIDTFFHPCFEQSVLLI